ncbi:MAG: methyltransferase domain-containing protein [Burkholderiales bacterium]
MSQATHEIDSPSPWVCRWARLIRPGGRVLDLACGRGRHARYLSALGFAVVAVDRDPAALATLEGSRGIETRLADLEASAWPFAAASFDGVIVTNYLHRPLFGNLVASLRAGGVLIYETFAAGNEQYGRPGNPEFLLRPNELLEGVEPLGVVAFEQGMVSRPTRAVIQRVCALRNGIGGAPLDIPPAAGAG